jgi:hypothetical protein
VESETELCREGGAIGCGGLLKRKASTIDRSGVGRGPGSLGQVPRCAGNPRLDIRCRCDLADHVWEKF